LVEAGVIIGIVWLAGQFGGRLLAVATALRLVLLTASIVARNLYSPWSVNLPVLPMVLLVFLTWRSSWAANACHRWWRSW
jgi:hypothetical protein